MHELYLVQVYLLDIYFQNHPTPPSKFLWSLRCSCKYTWITLNTSLQFFLPVLKKKEVKTKPKKPGKGKLTCGKKPANGNTRAIGTDCSGEENVKLIFTSS